MKLSRPHFEGLQALAASRTIQSCPRCSFRLSQRRQLSFTSPQQAVMGQVQMPKNIAGMAPSGARQSQQMLLKGVKSSQIPTDIGQLPLTFVSPPLQELYRMYKNDKRKLLTVLWLRIKRSVQSPLQYVAAYNFRTVLIIPSQAALHPQMEQKKESSYRQIRENTSARPYESPRGGEVITCQTHESVCRPG